MGNGFWIVWSLDLSSPGTPRLQNRSTQSVSFRFWCSLFRFWTLLFSIQNSYRFWEPIFRSRASILDHFWIPKPYFFDSENQLIPKTRTWRNTVKTNGVWWFSINKPIQNQPKFMKINIKNLIGFGYRFWTSFSRFWAPKCIQNGSKIDPKSRKKDEDHWTWGFLETIWIQNDPKWHQGLQKYPQNDPQSNDPQITPRALKTTPKWSPEIQNHPENEP